MGLTGCPGARRGSVADFWAGPAHFKGSMLFRPIHGHFMMVRASGAVQLPIPVLIIPFPFE